MTESKRLVFEQRLNLLKRQYLHILVDEVEALRREAKPSPDTVERGVRLRSGLDITRQDLRHRLGMTSCC